MDLYRAYVSSLPDHSSTSTASQRMVLLYSLFLINTCFRFLVPSMHFGVIVPEFYFSSSHKQQIYVLALPRFCVRTQYLLICGSRCIHTAVELFGHKASQPALQHGQRHILQDAVCLNEIRQLPCSQGHPDRMSAGNLQSAELIRYGLEAEHAMLTAFHEIILPQRWIFLSLQKVLSCLLFLFFKSTGC